MNGFIDNTYWIAVAHLPKWTVEVKTDTELFEAAIVNEANEPTVEYENDNRNIQKMI